MGLCVRCACASKTKKKILTPKHLHVLSSEMKQITLRKGPNHAHTLGNNGRTRLVTLLKSVYIPRGLLEETRTSFFNTQKKPTRCHPQRPHLLLWWIPSVRGQHWNAGRLGQRKQMFFFCFLYQTSYSLFPRIPTTRKMALWRKQTPTRHLLHKNKFLVALKQVSHPFWAVCSSKTKFWLKWKKRNPPFSQFLRSRKNHDGGEEGVYSAAKEVTKHIKGISYDFDFQKRSSGRGARQFWDSILAFSKRVSHGSPFFQTPLKRVSRAETRKEHVSVWQETGFWPGYTKNWWWERFFWNVSKIRKVQGYFPGL